MVWTSTAATEPFALARRPGARLRPASAVPQLAADLVLQVAPLERLGIEPLAIGIGVSLSLEARIFLGHAAGSPSIGPALFVSHLDPMTRYARPRVQSSRETGHHRARSALNSGIRARRGLSPLW